MAFHGARIAYAESMQTVREDLVAVRPTVAASVPRLYEKIHAAITEKTHSASPLKRSIFAWAMKNGRKKVRLLLKGEKLPLVLKLQNLIAHQLVYKKLKAGLGGRIRFFISGGAPLAKELAEFFYMAEVLILEGYGLTETSPVLAVNCEDNFKFGTVGRALPNVELKIAEDGEILARGPSIMKGYYKKPEETDEALKDGWFHTGDIGRIDEAGFLSIVDRKKDIIVTSGGKNISPQNIENELLQEPLIIGGDRRQAQWLLWWCRQRKSYSV